MKNWDCKRSLLTRHTQWCFLTVLQVHIKILKQKIETRTMKFVSMGKLKENQRK